MYLIWRSDSDLSEKFMHIGKKPKGFIPTRWKTGRAFQQDPPVITLEGDDDSPETLSDVILTGFNVPILSTRAISALKEVGVNNLQYYPVNIKNPQTKELDKSYKIVNVVGLNICWTGKIQFLRHLRMMMISRARKI